VLFDYSMNPATDRGLGGQPMKYLFLLNRAAGTGLPEPGTAEAAGLLANYGAVVTEMQKAGVLIDCAPLHTASASTTVRVRDGEVMITDGPSAEIKEELGGYTLVECADLDQALRWAAKIPAAEEASVEVRPVAEVRAPV
jgi:hypothetical protein